MLQEDERIDIDIPRAGWRYVQDICNTCSFPSSSGLPFYTDLLCVLKRGTLFGKWTIVHCMEGNNLCFVLADFFFLLHQTPFPASSPGETKGEYMILVRWSVLISSHQLWLLQQFKVTDPRTLCAVVGLSEMPYGTDWFMMVWILSRLFQAEVTTNMLKYLFSGLYRYIYCRGFSHSSLSAVLSFQTVVVLGISTT